MKILLIRHAEPDYINKTLTEKGVDKAEYLSENLQHSNIHTFIHHLLTELF